MAGDPNRAPANLLLVDDDPLVLRSWLRLLAVPQYLCFTAGSVAEAMQVLELERVDLVVTDMDLGGETGLDLIRRMAVSHPGTPAIVVTGVPALHGVIEALRLSVFDYVVKPANDLPARIAESLAKTEARRARERTERMLSELATMVEAASGQLKAACAVMESATPPGGTAAPPSLLLADLSEREQEVLAALRKGLSNKEIGARLFLSEHTIKTHLKAIFKKLGVSSRAELLTRFPA